jgi:hypothetical protein
MKTQYKTISSMMSARARHLRSCSRSFPKFYEGMSTAEYVRQYWGANARDLGIECGYKDEFHKAQRAAADFFAPLNYSPAAILTGPEVIAEAE